MSRGKPSDVGMTRTSANGYHYTRTEQQWRLTHHLIAEEKLGRPLNGNEIVRFIGSKEDLSPANIEVVVKDTTRLRKRKAWLEFKIAELQNNLRQVNELLEVESSLDKSLD